MKWLALAMTTFMLLMIKAGQSDVKSDNGVINFDSNSDGQSEAKLNQNGLGIGTSPSANLDVSGNAILTGELLIGTSNNSGSNLHVAGTQSQSFETLTESGTISNHSIVFADTSNSNLLLNLPPAGANEGRVLTIKSISNSNKVVVLGGGNYIDDDLSLSLTNDTTMMSYGKFLSSGDNWLVLSQSGITSNTDPASDNLIAYYPLDEASGNTVYDSQGTYHGNRFGFGSSGNGWVNGLVGSALDFDGTDDYVLLPPSMMNDQVGSMSAWIKTTANVTDTIRIIAFASSGNGNGLGGENELHFHLDTDSGEPQMFIEATAGGTDMKTHTTGSLNDGLWHHVVGTWDGNVGKIYQDAQFRDEDHYTPVGYTCDLATMIGHHSSLTSAPGRGWKGLIDEVRFYNKALTPGEITQLYQNIVFEEPVLQYDFEEGAGDTTRAEESPTSYLGTKTNFGTSGNGWVAGKFGSFALEFDGLDDIIDIEPKGLLSAGNISVSIWFKTSSSDRRFMFYLTSDGSPHGADGYGSDHELHIGIDSPGNVEVFGQGNGNDLFLSSASNYDDGNWHHAVLTISDTNGKLVIDNSDTDTDTWDNGEDIYSSTNIRIGGPGHNTLIRTWDGSLDELKIWNRAINDAEIQNLYLLGQ